MWGNKYKYIWRKKKCCACLTTDSTQKSLMRAENKK